MRAMNVKNNWHPLTSPRHEDEKINTVAKFHRRVAEPNLAIYVSALRNRMGRDRQTKSVEVESGGTHANCRKDKSWRFMGFLMNSLNSTVTQSALFNHRSKNDDPRKLTRFENFELRRWEYRILYVDSAYIIECSKNSLGPELGNE